MIKAANVTVKEYREDQLEAELGPILEEYFQNI